MGRDIGFEIGEKECVFAEPDGALILVVYFPILIKEHRGENNDSKTLRK